MLPLFFLSFYVEKKNKQANKDQGNQCETQNVPNFQLLDHLHYLQHISVQPACSFVVGVLSPCISFLIFPETEVCIPTTKKPRLKGTIEPDFHIPVSHGEDLLSLDIDDYFWAKLALKPCMA